MIVGALITAAGNSSRMGSFKPLLPIGGLSAAERVIQSFHLAGINTIVVVTGKNAEALEGQLKPYNPVFLRNTLYENTEMFDSVKIGLNYLKDSCSNILFSPVDIPLFSADTVKALLACQRAVGIPVFQGKKGHPIILKREAALEIMGYTGTGGLKGAITHLALETAYIPVPDPGILPDMDTQEDYANILKFYSNNQKTT